MSDDTQADVLAECVDNLTWLLGRDGNTNLSEGDVEALAARLAAVEDVKRLIRKVEDIVSTALVDHLDEDPVSTAVGRLVRRPVVSDRFQAGMSTKHMNAMIRDRVAALTATDPLTGEVADGLRLKVGQAIDTFTQALPCGTKPDADGLAPLGMEYDAFRRVERTGYRAAIEKKENKES